MLSTSERILRQVEYYFGDVNVTKDTFLNKTLSENNGWLPMEVLVKFKRLKDISVDFDIIKEALALSTLLDVGEQGVRRKPEIPAPKSLEEAIQLYSDRSVYIKGIPTSEKLDEIISWLDEVGGPTIDVFCKRHPQNKKFKGSVYVTFKLKEDAENFISSSESSKYKDVSLIRKWYKDYIEEKKLERIAREAERTKKMASIKSKLDAEVSAKMVQGALMEISGLPNSKSASKLSVCEDLKTASTTETAVIDDEKESDELTLDKKINTSNLSGARVKDLKQWLNEKLEPTVQVAWIDVNPAKNTAIVRFKEKDSAVIAMEALKATSDDGKISYKESDISLRVIAGDEEQTHWLKLSSNASGKRGKRHFASKVPMKRKRFN